jgi:hypothetical protein
MSHRECDFFEVMGNDEEIELINYMAKKSGIPLDQKNSKSPGD